jgi:serine/threonine protein kinase
LLQLHKEISRSELEILGKIGDGNAGSVYKGKYKGIDVAIKMFSKGTVNNSMDFKRELAMLRYAISCFSWQLYPDTTAFQFD